MAKYWWSEDGVSETVTVDSIYVDNKTFCYHCTLPIDCGADAVKLTTSDGDTYILHLECARKSVVE